MEQGTVKWFSAPKGFGFIKRQSGNDIFVHFSNIQSEGYKTLTENEPVSFDVEHTEKGLQAVAVTRLNPPTQ